MAFIGVEVPESVSDYLAGMGAPGAPEDPATMHITMVYLGKKAPVEKLLRATLVLYRLCEETGPFNAGFAVRTSFPDRGNGTPVIARVISPGLHAFRKTLCERLRAAGVDYDEKFPEFKPHVTMSYSGTPVPDAPLRPTVWTIGSIAVWGGDSGKVRMSTLIDLTG